MYSNVVVMPCWVNGDLKCYFLPHFEKELKVLFWIRFKAHFDVHNECESYPLERTLHVDNQSKLIIGSNQPVLTATRKTTAIIKHTLTFANLNDNLTNANNIDSTTSQFCYSNNYHQLARKSSIQLLSQTFYSRIECPRATTNTNLFDSGKLTLNNLTNSCK